MLILFQGLEVDLIRNSKLKHDFCRYMGLPVRPLTDYFLQNCTSFSILMPFPILIQAVMRSDLYSLLPHPSLPTLCDSLECYPFKKFPYLYRLKRTLKRSSHSIILLIWLPACCLKSDTVLMNDPCE